MSRLSELRLGVISSVVGTLNARGHLMCNHAMGRLVDRFRQVIPHTRICTPIVPHGDKAMNHEVAIPPEDIVALPPLASVIRSQVYHFQSRRVLKQFAAESDVLFMRVPFQLPSALLGLRTPKLVHIVGNPYQVIAASTDYRGPLRFLALRFAAHTGNAIRRMCHEPHTRVAANGREMWDQVGGRAGRVVVSSCIWEREMQPRQDLALRDPPRLLFVGYLRPEKGAGYLLDAFEMLRRKRPLKLTIVGGSDRASKVEAELLDRIKNSPFRDDITITGMIDFGEALFEQYRGHDLYLLPSLSEGTPRTLIEARAFGCPVVATRAGGIPSSVADGRDGLLVNPADSQDLAAAIERVLDDEPLRLRLIEGGLERSRRHTLEAFADELVEEIEALACESPAAARH